MPTSLVVFYMINLIFLVLVFFNLFMQNNNKVKYLLAMTWQQLSVLARILISVHPCLKFLPFICSKHDCLLWSSFEAVCLAFSFMQVTSSMPLVLVLHLSVVRKHFVRKRNSSGGADDGLLTAEAVEIYSELPAQVVSSGGRV